MHSYFTLKNREGKGITPSHGEEMGMRLAEAGDAIANSENYRVSYHGRIVIEFYELAADAFERGATASLGHKRTERYHEAARLLRAKADAVHSHIEESRDA